MAYPIKSALIVVPAYNMEHYLLETLNSVAAQTDDNFVCVVVDDGSTDNTSAVAQIFCKEDNRFLFVMQENKGLSAARNTGWKVGKRELGYIPDRVMFLDSDDTLQDDALQILTMKRKLGIDPIGQAFRIAERNYTRDIIWNQEMQFHHDYTFENISVWWPICNIAQILLNGHLVEEVGAFDSSLRAMEDYDFYLKYSAAGGKFRFYPHVVMNYRVREGSLSRSALHDQFQPIVYSRIPKYTEAYTRFFVEK